MYDGRGLPQQDLRAEVALARADYETFVEQLRQVVTAADEGIKGRPDPPPPDSQ